MAEVGYSSADWQVAVQVAQKKCTSAGIGERCPCCGAPVAGRDWWGGRPTVIYKCGAAVGFRTVPCPKAAGNEATKKGWPMSIVAALKEEFKEVVVTTKATVVLALTYKWRARHGAAMEGMREAKKRFHSAIYALRRTGHCIRVGRGIYHFLL